MSTFMHQKTYSRIFRQHSIKHPQREATQVFISDNTVEYIVVPVCSVITAVRMDELQLWASINVTHKLGAHGASKKEYLLYNSSYKHAKLWAFQDNVYLWKGSNWMGKRAVSRWVLVGKILRWPLRVLFSDIYATYNPLSLSVSRICEYNGILLPWVSYVILQR